MIQFKENAWTERWKNGSMERWMDGPYFLGPFWLSIGVQSGNKKIFNYWVTLEL